MSVIKNINPSEYFPTLKEIEEVYGPVESCTYEGTFDDYLGLIVVAQVKLKDHPVFTDGLLTETLFYDMSDEEKDKRFAHMKEVYEYVKRTKV